MLRVLLPFLVLAAPAAAQRADEQLWLQANGSASVGKGVTVTLESIGRFSDRAGGLSDSQFGGIVSYKLSDRVEIGAGYRHVQDYDHGGSLPDEERLRQQIGIELGGGFSTRARIEQTFRAASPGVAVRWRQQLRFTQPIGKHRLAVFASHESFFNLNDTRQRSGYDRMRNMVGLGVPLSKALKGEFGYINQVRFGRAGARDTMDHIASFALTLTL